MNKKTDEMISVTIPVYNEEKNINELYVKLIKTLTGMACDFEIVFVNDGSSDASAVRLNELSEKDTRVKVIHFTRNFGQTAAMMAGFDHASGDIIIPMDADLQNDPEDIPKLVAKLAQGFDLCSGWRKNRKDNTFRKVFVSKIANKLVSKISGVKLKDYGCTLKAYRKKIIKGVRLYGEMHRFIPIYASWEGARITELPVKHHARIHGKSKYGLERTIKVLLDLIVITFLDNYAQKPIYVFGGAGFVSAMISMGIFFYATWLKYFKGVFYIDTPLPVLASMTMLGAFMCILLGLLAEMIMRTYYETQQKSIYLIEDVKNFEGNKK
ncbi:MAG: glycosyltransferase family 2 protein [Desulfobacula sp.]|uniref:glycosyltransferase family 2 protein n=1 Tax=Desulfobacula sp. TaxID=2593537 RepID=UPI0025C70AEA|nr:glycosyltransferase family 2 protein [Desulfobacula sp.]MCD4721404.1 glycosyltransferase family 2 protein [Desulfobacula sp.]